ncbi:MAG: hypothetical protein Q8P40_13565 [Nitrospirota bacterium]|nr:hypothetical protein [Nitrospirota bacterium]
MAEADNRTPGGAIDVSDRAARLLGVVYGSQGQQLQQDPVKKNLITINHSQEAGHAGIKYISSDVVTGLGSGATKQYLIIAPDTATRIHLIYSVEATPGITITFYEAPTKTANGTALAINNRNRNSANTATAAVYKDPTITANGTLLRINEVGSGAAGGKAGGISASDRDEREWILKQNTAYLLNIVTLAASTDIATALQWYEV